MSRDNELDQLLESARNLNPNEIQMQKWQLAVRRELNKKEVKRTSKFSWQLVAATMIGVIIGAYLQKTFQPQTAVEQISVADATFESSHANLD